ncbi:MAG: EF-hand domain-containing protein [Algibacter sp.]
MKNKNFKTAALVFGITVLASTSMFAQPQNNQEKKERPTVEQLFKEMDKNEDAKLSKKEVKGPLKNDFDKIDTNEDGFLTKKEIEKAPKPKRRED